MSRITSNTIFLKLILCLINNECIAFTITSLSPVSIRESRSLCHGKLFLKEDKLPFFADEIEDVKQSPKAIDPSQAVFDEASDALTSVGWSAPMLSDEMTSEDPFVQRIDAQIQEDFGVGLDGLLNPAKVINLERDLYNLRSELASLTGKPSDFNILEASTEECDGSGGGEKADKIRKKNRKEGE